MALLFPSIINTNFINVLLFYYEHLIPFFVVLYTKFVYLKKTNFLDFMQHQYYFSYFCLYQRYILYPMSLYTWANLNFTLCGHPKDPFRLYIDKYYIIFSEIYLSFGSYLFRHMMK